MARKPTPIEKQGKQMFIPNSLIKTVEALKQAEKATRPMGVRETQLNLARLKREKKEQK